MFDVAEILARSSPASSHRLVVRSDDAPVATHHRRQRDRLGYAQQHVSAGPVRDGAVEFPAPKTAAARNLAFEHHPESPSAAAPRLAHALASLGPAASFSKKPKPCDGEAILPIDATIAAASRRKRNKRIPVGPCWPDMRSRIAEQGTNERPYRPVSAVHVPRQSDNNSITDGRGRIHGDDQCAAA